MEPGAIIARQVALRLCGSRGFGRFLDLDLAVFDGLPSGARIFLDRRRGTFGEVHAFDRADQTELVEPSGDLGCSRFEGRDERLFERENQTVGDLRERRRFLWQPIFRVLRRAADRERCDERHDLGVRQARRIEQGLHLLGAFVARRREKLPKIEVLGGFRVGDAEEGSNRLGVFGRLRLRGQGRIDRAAAEFALVERQGALQEAIAEREPNEDLRLAHEPRRRRLGFAIGRHVAESQEPQGIEGGGFSGTDGAAEEVEAREFDRSIGGFEAVEFEAHYFDSFFAATASSIAIS